MFKNSLYNMFHALCLLKAEKQVEKEFMWFRHKNPGILELPETDSVSAIGNPKCLTR